MAAAKSNPLALVCGDDDFAVKQRAKQIFTEWSAELGGMDHEIIEATAGNSGDALTALGKLREALNTLPFFGGGKAVWLRDCNFLGEERTASAAAVTEMLASLSEELKTFQWQNVRLLISAGKVDKRKTFFKTLDKLGNVEIFSAWSVDDKDWADRADDAARTGFKQRQKEFSEEALAELINRVGPNARQLESEVEKLCLSIGDRKALNSPMSPPSAPVTKPPAPLRWAMPWVTATCPPCSAASMRNFGKPSSIKINPRSVCFTASSAKSAHCCS